METNIENTNMMITNPRYIKKDNENNFDYGLRLIDIKCGENPLDLDWQDIVDMLDLKIHRDSLRKACNTTEFGSYNVMKYFKDKLENNIEDNEVLNELENKKKELEKEKIKFQDQKREYKNYLRADARFEHLKETLMIEVKKINKEKPLLNKFEGIFLGDREATLILSDLHLGLEVKNRWNHFNIEIAKERLSDLKNQTIENCKRHEVKVLRIELLGDLINGYIHVGTRISNEEDVISQSMICAELLSEFVDQLAKEIPQIYIYSATGNHGRCMPNIKDSLEVENFERLIPWYIKSRIQCKNVNFVENIEDDNMIIYTMFNETVFAVHGHQEKLGTVISDLSKMLKIFPTEVHMGHYHRHSTLEDNDMELIINGSFAGTDDYAKSIRKSNKPSQTLIIYNSQGQECLYKIKL